MLESRRKFLLIDPYDSIGSDCDLGATGPGPMLTKIYVAILGT